MWGSIKGKNKIVCKWFIDNQPPINLFHRNEDDKNVIVPTYESFNTLIGYCRVKCNSEIKHDGIKIALKCVISSRDNKKDSFYVKIFKFIGYKYPQGILQKHQEFGFKVDNILPIFDSFVGSLFSISYYLYIKIRLPTENYVDRFPIWVSHIQTIPRFITDSVVIFGMSDLILFKFYLDYEIGIINDFITGSIVCIKNNNIVYNTIQINILRKEYISINNKVFDKVSSVLKYEIVDGVMSLAESIPFRFHLNSFLFTPHYNSPITNIDDNLTVQLNISYFLQIEVILSEDKFLVHQIPLHIYRHNLC